MIQAEQKLVDGLKALILPALQCPNDLSVVIGRDQNYFKAVVSVHPIDMPRVIGKGGNNVRALKAIMAHIGQRNRCFIGLHIADPRNPTQERPVVPPAGEWDSRSLVKAAVTALRMALYDGRLIAPQCINEKWYLNSPEILDETFGEALARWLHVIGRLQGVSLIFCAERVPSAKRAAL